jgi:Heparinase II/III-like protein
MAIFLNTTEKAAFLGKNSANTDGTSRYSREGGYLSLFFDALQKRVYERVGWGNLLGENATTIWWHSAAEYLSDAAMSFALKPTPELANWIKKETLEIARKPTYDWVGPAFRDHSEPLTGHLETAHLCWGVAAVYDLAKDAFSETEQAEIRRALQEKGITLCRRWIDKNQHLANWRSILVSGAMVAAVILEDETTVLDLLPELDLCQQALQDDGSYGESLQYGNYLLLALTFAHEAVLRRYPTVRNPKSVFPKPMRWFATSQFYAKKMKNWGDEPMARAANFNDSASIFRPSGDVLLHIAARSTDKIESGLAYWLFERYYVPVPYQGPHDLGTLGMRNDWGFLTLPLLANAPLCPDGIGISYLNISPEKAHLPLTTMFSNGNGFIRDAWDGKTIVATNGGSEPLNGLGHLHGDLNSFILAHNQDRLLADPGHSCYRNLIHGLESSSQTHNTCTFLIDKEALGLQEDLAKASFLEQKSVFQRRTIKNGVAGDKILRGDKRLICEKNDVVSVIGSEVAQVYGQPLEEFSRFWVLAGSHVLFIVDKIMSNQPVTTLWNWCVNNHDGKTIWEKNGQMLTVKRQNGGMKLFHGGTGAWAFPVHGFLHDAYHPEPNQLGEGHSGSSLLFRFTEKTSQNTRMVVHAIALDTPELLENWHFEQENNQFTLKSDTRKWSLVLHDDTAFSLISGHGRTWRVAQSGEKYDLIKL